MEGIVNWLRETHQKNWILFTVVLGIVNAIWLRCLTGHWFCFNIEKNHAGFLALEILLTSLAVTRILVAMDIIYLLQIAPITGDLVILVDRRKRNIIRSFKAYPPDDYSLGVLEEHIFEALLTDSAAEKYEVFDYSLFGSLLHNNMLIDTDTITGEPYIQYYIQHYFFKHHEKTKKYYTAIYCICASLPLILPILQTISLYICT
jgi:hypothetical protein